jgi:hypothetical protein
METKFKLIETEDYILAVSDEDASNSCIYFTGDPTGIFKTGIKYKNEAGDYFYQDAITGMSNTYLAKISKKIIGYQPKGNAPGLLHIVKLPSDENVNVQKISRLPLLPDVEPRGFDEFEYTEEDLRKAIELALREFVKDYQMGNPLNITEYQNKVIQSLKQPKTPKWFVAKLEPKNDFEAETGNCSLLKTTTINNKIYLIGTYLN